MKIIYLRRFWQNDKVRNISKGDNIIAKVLIDEFYSNENYYVLPYSSTYQVIKRGFIKSALWENQNYGCI